MPPGYQDKLDALNVMIDSHLENYDKKDKQKINLDNGDEIQKLFNEENDLNLHKILLTV